MKLSRPVVIALVGFVLAAVLFLLTRSIGGSDTANVPSPVTTDVTSTTATTTTTTASTAQTTTGTGKVSQVGLPIPVARALALHKVIVVLVWSPNAIEDRKVKAAVDRLSSSQAGSVAVFKVPAREVGRYATLIDNLRQTPALVVIDRQRNARTIQGYIDYTSIVQLVKEAKRSHP